MVKAQSVYIPALGISFIEEERGSAIFMKPKKHQKKWDSAYVDNLLSQMVKEWTRSLSLMDSYERSASKALLEVDRALNVSAKGIDSVKAIKYMDDQIYWYLFYAGSAQREYRECRNLENTRLDRLRREGK